jgi:hypothetical protein
MTYSVRKLSCVERAIADEVITPYLTQSDKLNDDFLINRLSPFSKLIKSVILQKGFSHKTIAERNIYIRKTTDKLFALLPKRLSHLFFAGDDDIQLLAKECVAFCRQCIVVPNNVELLSLHNEVAVNESKTVNGNNREKQGGFEQRNITGFSVNGKAGTCNPVNGMSNQAQNFVYEHLCRYVTTYNISPPIAKNHIKISGCLKRLSDNRWWLRRIRKLITQANEKAAILLNLVNRRKQIYASNVTTRNRLAQLAKNEQLLSSSFIINQAGQRYSLKEISDLNVSNPAVRKAELMNRAKGFENIADDSGHQGLFITITCPSKYHRAYSKSGAENPKWNGLMPDDSQRYLNQVWSRIRAQLKRENIQPYGFRVVEPQHDGTPHWHSLLFVKPEQIKKLKETISHYALAEDGDEKGAQENRCDFKVMDKSKGSATSYILKYITKSIDGVGLGEDKFGNDAITVAKRINAWASCWCIRQFQQIGGASVSVWRELRRLKEKFFPESILEKARIAADSSNWQGYISAMGGIERSVKAQPIKLHYNVNVNTDTGECLLSYYDGEIVNKIKGLSCDGQIIITRKHQWQLEQAA